jgi:hypothetical protein
MIAATLLTRRAWLIASLTGLAALPRRLGAQWPGAVADHPTPRAGITGAKVATGEMLDGDPVLTELFDAVRRIPGVVDGIRCHCGCADSAGHYSLLSCYEGPNAMARICPICQGEGRVAVRLARSGRSLQDIRVAIDAQFG